MPFPGIVRIVCLVLTAAIPAAAQNFEKVEINTIPLSAGLYMLVGAGGNIGLSVGADGVFLVDDQYAPLTPKIKAAIAAITDKPVRFVLNTHWHGDHTGGNEHMAESGTLILAHENVRKRMSTRQFIALLKDTVPASPKAALPVVTFTDAIALFINDETVRATHVAPAHTDGDAIVVFEHANVLHAGDVFFNGFYPFVDLSSGGSVNGTIKAVDMLLAMANDSTRIIPGHGPLATKADLIAYRTTLATIRDRVQVAVRNGRTLKQVLAGKPSADFDDKWGKGFMKPDTFISIVYESLSSERLGKRLGR